MFLIFITFKKFYFSSVKNVKNTSENHCQTYFKSPLDHDKTMLKKSYFSNWNLVKKPENVP